MSIKKGPTRKVVATRGRWGALPEADDGHRPIAKDSEGHLEDNHKCQESNEYDVVIFKQKFLHGFFPFFWLGLEIKECPPLVGAGHDVMQVE